MNIQNLVFLIKNFCCSNFILKPITKLANRTEPTLDDVAGAFNKYQINISDLEEYINWVDTPEFVLSKHDDKTSLSMFNRTNKKKPIKTYRDYLGYCDDPDNKEIKDRENEEDFEHIYDYFPLMTRMSVHPPPTLSTTNEQATLSSNISISNQINDSKTDNLLLLDSARIETQTATVIEEEKAKEIVKNGTTFNSNLYNSSYKPKYLRDSLNKTINRTLSTIETEKTSTNLDVSFKPTSSHIKLPEPKMHTNFHKPESVSSSGNIIAIFEKCLKF